MSLAETPSLETRPLLTPEDRFLKGIQLAQNILKHVLGSDPITKSLYFTVEDERLRKIHDGFAQEIELMANQPSPQEGEPDVIIVGEINMLLRERQNSLVVERGEIVGEELFGWTYRVEPLAS